VVPVGNVISQNPAEGLLVDEGSAVNLVVSGGLPDLTVSLTNISLSQASPSATVTVSNIGDGTLSWAAGVDDAAIEVAPGVFTGNSTSVTISTSDFSKPYTAQVTFANDDDPADTEVVALSVTGEMASVPAGAFEMGDAFDEGAANELPAHTVTLSAYTIGKYEVTNQEFADILNWALETERLAGRSGDVWVYERLLLEESSPYCSIGYSGSEYIVDERDGYSMANHPVVLVTWFGAAVYCNWLSEWQGLEPCYDTDTWTCDFSRDGYHLPTEAQWERAAAWDPSEGGYHYRYGNGSDSISPANVNYDENNPLGLSGHPYTSPVGYYTAVTSPAGCFDMSGNVWEWCNDVFNDDYYSSSPAISPEGPASGSTRVVRGGSWYNPATYQRSANRADDAASNVRFWRGFRVAR
ncbi:MAG: SUMF1/EgtB/PvdO family nonheme iron enzyme, partial [Candidatus Hydrogenedentota bacterium]